MRRTSFVGALTVIALGGALAFGVQSSPKDLDIHLTGLIIMIAGIADLALRFLIADSPLFSQSTADVAAVLEPMGEPVLDAFGNPVTYAEPAAAPPLVAPVIQPVVQPVETTQALPVVVAPRVVAAPEAPPPPVPDADGPDQFVRTVGDHATDESLVPVSPLTGRPLRTRRRRRLR
jgi:hypothetical protein